MNTPDLGLCAIHHVGVVVADVDAAVADYLERVGGRVEVRAELPEQGVDAAAVRSGSGEIEFIAPLHEDSGIHRFLARRGPGLHHVAWSVMDIEASLAAASQAGLRLIDTSPRPGLHGSPVAFIHPASMQGVLTELIQDTTS